MRDFDPTLGQFALQPMQGQMRCRLNPLDNEVPMGIENGLAVAAHLARCHRAYTAVALRPLYHRGHSNPEPFDHRTAALTSQHLDPIRASLGKPPIQLISEPL